MALDAYSDGQVMLPPPEQFGFCEGVVSADDLLRDVSRVAAERALPVFGYHEIVHNAIVRKKHEQAGVVFVDDLEQIPPHSVVVTSAHGVSPEVVAHLRQQGSEQFDAACPLVLHTHKGIQAARKQGEKVLYIGHGKPGQSKKLHDEIVGALGHMDFAIEDGQLVRSPVERTFLELGEELAGIEDLLTKNAKYRIITQTTLNDLVCLAYMEQVVAHVKGLQPEASIAKMDRTDVCRAVRKRQEGVHVLLGIPSVRRLVVVTDPNSANGMGYFHQAQELVAAQGLNVAVKHVAGVDEVQATEVDGITAITASASTPDSVTKEVAVAFGADPESLAISRPSFKLHDANPAVMDARLRALKARRET